MSKSIHQLIAEQRAKRELSSLVTAAIAPVLAAQTASSVIQNGPTTLSLFDRLRLARENAQNETRKETQLSTNVSSIHKENPSSTSDGRTVSETLESDIPKVSSEAHHISHTTDKHGNTITYNRKQQEFISLVSTGQSAILIGAAGTGKTTSQKGAITSLIQSGNIPPLGSHSHKYLPSSTPGIVICAYTRRATNNIRKNLSEDMRSNCITIHKLLEYEPQYFDVYNEETGTSKSTMQFLPARNADNPLPESIKVIVLEEASMISVELFKQIIDALHHQVQFIFLGDIQQLPPVFGSAILGFKMLELPVIELTEVYRQALESPIIRLAHRILSGVPIPASEFDDWKYPNQLTLHAWKKKIDSEVATITLAKMFLQFLGKKIYTPETDAILIPFNKSCGTDELNKHIAGAVAERDSKLVYEIIHGFKKSYYSVGDKCLYDKEDAIITNIYKNPEYTGIPTKPESVSLNYWGHLKRTGNDTDIVPGQESEADVDILLQSVHTTGSDEDTVRAASHVVELSLLDTERKIKIKASGELNNLILGYAITVHKSQGSEWPKVFLCLHQSHNTMLSRELLYTAVTRPKQELFVVCESDSFIKGINSQRIQGNTLAEKAEHFKGKRDRNEEQS